jgi:RND family efflux transporter MFP subunit
VPEDQIKRIEQKGPQRTLIFRSPIAGTVVEKEIVKGHYLEPDMMLYRIADLSEVWIIANVYENEVNRLDRGLLATVRVQGVPGSFKARIDFLHPTLDETTRTLRVRLVAPNPAGLFRPGSFATVELPVRGTEVVWVPDEAVIDTGTRQLVYLALPGGRFRPRQVLVGRRGGGRTEIVRGLQGGEQVVVSAQFLLDSESRLRGAGSEGAGGHQGHQ